MWRSRLGRLKKNFVINGRKIFEFELFSAFQLGKYFFEFLTILFKNFFLNLNKQPLNTSHSTISFLLLIQVVYLLLPSFSTTFKRKWEIPPQADVNSTTLVTFSIVLKLILILNKRNQHKALLLLFDRSFHKLSGSSDNDF